jgi:hypothetical protein
MLQMGRLHEARSAVRQLLVINSLQLAAHYQLGVILSSARADSQNSARFAVFSWPRPAPTVAMPMRLSNGSMRPSTKIRDSCGFATIRSVRASKPIRAARSFGANSTSRIECVASTTRFHPSIALPGLKHKILVQVSFVESPRDRETTEWSRGCPQRCSSSV